MAKKNMDLLTFYLPKKQSKMPYQAMSITNLNGAEKQVTYYIRMGNPHVCCAKACIKM